ncbi:MAG: helix-turn-helix domain-containing protein [Actinomycetota bacterium]|nr:helix-turn-helix domain-containing protein [Actinomycetota bacterium]
MTKLLTLPEAAEILRTSVKHLYALRAEGKLPVVRVGGLLRMTEADLEAFIEAGRS